MKLNRARRNDREKSPSAQSANAPKSSPGQTPEGGVWIQLITAEGTILPDLKIPQALYDSLLASVPAQPSAGQPVAELPPCTVILSPVCPTQRKSVTSTIELSDDVHEFIEKVAGGPDVEFSGAFHRVVLRGMSALASEKTVKNARGRLSEAFWDIEGIHQEMNFFVQSVRAAMPTWNSEGQPTKEHLDDMQVGFMRLWDRLDRAARETIVAACNASRESSLLPSNTVAEGGAR